MLYGKLLYHFSIFLSIRRIKTPCKDFLNKIKVIPESTFNAELCLFYTIWVLINLGMVPTLF
jgi:hypothetical protein